MEQSWIQAWDLRFETVTTALYFVPLCHKVVTRKKSYKAVTRLSQPGHNVSVASVLSFLFKVWVANGEHYGRKSKKVVGNTHYV